MPNRVGFDELSDGIEMRSKTCGSRMKISVTLNEEGRVRSLRQAVEACAFGQASAAIMARSARGLDAAEVEVAANRIARWLTGERDAPEDWHDIEILEPARSRKGRHEAILLPYRTLAAAIREAGG